MRLTIGARLVMSAIDLSVSPSFLHFVFMVYLSVANLSSDITYSHQHSTTTTAGNTDILMAGLKVEPRSLQCLTRSFSVF